MNIIDLRDIVDKQETEPDTYEAWKTALWDDAGYAIDDVAENEPTMMPEYDFTEYAQELVEDIGAIIQMQSGRCTALTGNGQRGSSKWIMQESGSTAQRIILVLLIVYVSWHSDRPREANNQGYK